MTDTFRVVIALILFVIAIFLGIPPLAKYFSKVFNVTTQDAFNILVLGFNCIVILIMLLTIYFNNKSSLNEIKAIKDATKNHISKMEEHDKKTKSALLSAMIAEYKTNLWNMKDILKHEADYTDKEHPLFAEHRFSYEALQANLNNGTIPDFVLLDKIIQVYSACKMIQSFVDSARSPGVSNAFRASSSEKAINNIKENLKEIEVLLPEMVQYKKEHYDLTQ